MGRDRRRLFFRVGSGRERVTVVPTLLVAGI